MPYLPPEVIGLLLAIGAFCGVVMMVGIRIAMRSELEPLSRRARWMLVSFLLALALGGLAVYQLAQAVLDT